MSGFTSDKERYCSMKLKLKELLYDNELKQDELRKLQSELLDVYRDKEILLEQCLQYEDPLDSSNSDSESQTSDNVISANQQNQQFIKQQPLMTATPMPAATQSSNHLFHQQQHPTPVHQQQQVYTTFTSTTDTGTKMSTIEQNVASGNINLIQPMESNKPMEPVKPMESMKPTNQIGYIPKQPNITVAKASPNAKPKTNATKSRSKAAPKTNQTRGATTTNKAGGASKQTTAKNQRQKQQTDKSSEQKQKQQPQHPSTQSPTTSQPPEQVLPQQSHIPMIGYQPPMTILGQVQLPVSSSDQFKLVPQTIGQNLANNNNIQIVSNVEPSISSMGDRNPQANSYMSNQQQLQPIQHQNQVNHMVHQIHLQHPDQQQQIQHQNSPQGEIQLQNINQFQEQHQQNTTAIKATTAKPKTTANKSRSRAAPKTNQNKGALTNNKSNGASRQTAAKNQKQKQQTNQSSEQKSKQNQQNQQNQQQQQQQKQQQLQQDQVLTQQSHIPMIGYQPPMTILGQVQVPVTSSEQFKLVPQMDTIGSNLTNNSIQLVNNIDPMTSMGNQNHQANSYISSQQQLQPIQHQNQVTHMVHQIHLQHPDHQHHHQPQQQHQSQLQHSPQEEIQLQNVHQFQEQQHHQNQHQHQHLIQHIHQQQQQPQTQPHQHLKHQMVVTEEPLSAEELEQHLESRRMEQTDLLMPDWDSEVPSEIFGTDSAIKFMAED